MNKFEAAGFARSREDQMLRRAFYGLDPEAFPEDQAFLPARIPPEWEESALLIIITNAIAMPGHGAVTGYLMDSMRWYVEAREKRYRDPTPEEAEETEITFLSEYLQGS